MRGAKFFRGLLCFTLFVLLLGGPAYGETMTIYPTQVPLRQRTADVTVETYGGVAETTLNMSYYNPNPWRVGLAADFRLSHGATLVDFAFEMPGGSMRRGVPVSRLQRHVPLDDVKETPGDISLIQERRAAYHQFRLFPFEAGETKAMEIRHISDLLPWSADGVDLRYNLPITWNVEYPPNRLKIASERSEIAFTFRMTVHGNGETPYALDRNGEKLFFTTSGEEHTFEHTYDPGESVPFDAIFDREINIVLPGAGRSGSRVQTTDSGRYFYTVVNSEQLVPLIRSSNAPPPSRIGIAWDSSLSGVLRNHDMEYQFLDAYFKRLLAADGGGERELRVSLFRFRNDVEAVREFVIDRSSGWGHLRRELALTAYDGATNYRAARSAMSIPVDEWLFFSDGHENYGLDADRKSEAPIHAITAPFYTYPKRLRQFATVNGGALADLALQSPEEAVDLVRKPRVRLVRLEGSGLSDLLPSVRTIGEGEVILLSGRMAGNQGSAKLTFKGGDESTVILNVPVTSEISSPLASKEWARMKTDELYSNVVQIDTARIQRIGREYGIVSPAVTLVIPRGEGEAGADAVPRAGAPVGEADGQYPADQLKEEWADVLSRVKNPEGSAVEMGSLRGPFRDETSEFLWLELRPREEWSVPLNTYLTNASYRENLRSVPQNRAYEVYLANSSHYWTTPDFFLDSSNVLFEYGMSDLGLRVLSSLAEVDAENKWVLRTVAYRLMELGSPQARVIFEKILKLDEDDPQSYRDVALMYARNGDMGRAFEILDFVAGRTWGEAYGSVQLAALRDMNMIKAGQEKLPAAEKIDPALLNAPPIDMRVMLAADRSSANLRLRITDGEGVPVEDGLISFSRAPGRVAEELLLPKARSGRYAVRVGYDEDYPREQRLPTLALVTLVTHVGTRVQSEWIKTVRLTPGEDGMTAVMEFDFDADRTQHMTDGEAAGSGGTVITAGLLAAAGLFAVVFVSLRGH